MYKYAFSNHHFVSKALRSQKIYDTYYRMEVVFYNLLITYLLKRSLSVDEYKIVVWNNILIATLSH